MNWLVDTCVWSLAFRRNAESSAPAVETLRSALRGAGHVFTTGFVLQELLQGFSGPKARETLLSRFSALGYIEPTRADHIEAANIRNICRRHGVQIGTVDALLIQLSRHHQLQLLTTDKDFSLARQHVDFPLKWSSTEDADR